MVLAIHPKKIRKIVTKKTGLKQEYTTPASIDDRLAQITRPVETRDHGLLCRILLAQS
jgi:hypothetical protein